MPNYDYECTKCGHTFEAFQKMTDAKLTKCPECKGRVKRLIGSGTGIIFKGSGFYQTDYKNAARALDKGKPAPSAGETSGKEQPKPAACPKQKEGCNGCR